MKRIFENKIKLLVFLSALSVVMSSGKCGGGGTTNPPGPFTEVNVGISSSWPGQFPLAWRCGNFGPMIGNNPRLDVGTCSASDRTKRFSEVTVRRISDNSEFDKKCWGPNSSNDIRIKVPSSGAYEVKFVQYDKCSEFCMQLCGNGRCYPIRVIWEWKEVYSFVNYAIHIQPRYSTYAGCF